MLQAEGTTVGIYIPDLTALLLAFVKVIVLPLKWEFEVARRMDEKWLCSGSLSCTSGLGGRDQQVRP